MPNILSITPEEYTRANIKAQIKDVTASQDDVALYRNYIRWRQITKSDGSIGRQTNTKLVQWEDDTYSLFVGSEVLSVSRRSIPNTFLCVNADASSAHECTFETITDESIDQGICL